MEQSIRFDVEGHVYELPLDRIPKDCMLNLLRSKITTMNVPHRQDDKSMIIELNETTRDEFEHVYNYLVHGVYPSQSAMPVLDYMNIPLFDNYDVSIQQEVEMRKNMYLPEFQQHPMNTDPHFNLIKVDEQLWNELIIDRATDPDLLFNRGSLVKQPWHNVQQSLAALNPITDVSPHFFVAGGSIFAALFGTRTNDVDVFLHGCDKQQGEQLLYKFATDVAGVKIKKHDDVYYRISQITRTKNALSFDKASRKAMEHQIILRIYRTPSEILHGFDVDSCSLGYDGKNIWATQRALFAIKHGYNTVNFDRLSPSYEHRLVKYGTRGVAVKIPNFYRSRVNTVSLRERWDRFIERTSRTTYDGEKIPYGNMRDRYDRIKTKHLSPVREQSHQDHALHGLDTLLYLEFHCSQYKYNKNTLKTVQKLADESSDYCPVPYQDAHSTFGTMIDNIMGYLDESAEIYKEQAAQYLPYLTHMMDVAMSSDEKTAFSFRTNNIPKAPKLEFLKTTSFRNTTLDVLRVLFHIPDNVYNCLGAVRPWTLPQHIDFKITNPGEQMTGTFHKIVLEDNKEWYKGMYYTI